MNRLIYLNTKKKSRQHQFIPYLYQYENKKIKLNAQQIDEFITQQLKQNKYQIQDNSSNLENMKALIEIFSQSNNAEYVFQLLEYINAFIEIYYYNNNCQHEFNVPILAQMIRHLIKCYDDMYASVFLEFIDNVLKILVLTQDDRFQLFINEMNIFLIIVNLKLYLNVQILDVLNILDQSALITEDQILQILFLALQYVYTLQVSETDIENIYVMENVIYIINSIIGDTEFQCGLSFQEIYQATSQESDVLTIQNIKDQLRNQQDFVLNENNNFYNNISVMIDSICQLIFNILPCHILQSYTLPQQNIKSNILTIDNLPFKIVFSTQFIQKYFKALGIILCYNQEIYIDHARKYKDAYDIFQNAIKQYFNDAVMLPIVIKGLVLSGVSDFLDQVIIIMEQHREKYDVLNQCLDYFHNNYSVISTNQISRLISIYNSYYEEQHVSTNNSIGQTATLTGSQLEDKESYELQPPQILLPSKINLLKLNNQIRVRQLIKYNFTSLFKVLSDQSLEMKDFIEESIAGDYLITY